MTFGTSGYDQCIQPVGVVSWWWIHSLPHMKHCYSSCLCSFWQPHPYFLFNFCKLCFIFVFANFLDFSNLISERIIEARKYSHSRVNSGRANLC